MEDIEAIAPLAEDKLPYKIQQTQQLQVKSEWTF